MILSVVKWIVSFFKPFFSWTDLFEICKCHMELREENITFYIYFRFLPFNIVFEKIAVKIFHINLWIAFRSKYEALSWFRRIDQNVKILLCTKGWKKEWRYKKYCSQTILLRVESYLKFLLFLIKLSFILIRLLSKVARKGNTAEISSLLFWETRYSN